MMLFPVPPIFSLRVRQLGPPGTVTDHYHQPPQHRTTPLRFDNPPAHSGNDQTPSRHFFPSLSRRRSSTSRPDSNPSGMKANGAFPAQRERWWYLDSETNLSSRQPLDPLILMGRLDGIASNPVIGHDTDILDELEEEVEDPELSSALLYHQFLFGQVDMAEDDPSEPNTPTAPPPFWTRLDPVYETDTRYPVTEPPMIPPKSEARYSGSSTSTGSSKNSISPSIVAESSGNSPVTGLAIPGPSPGPSSPARLPASTASPLSSGHLTVPGSSSSVIHLPGSQSGSLSQSSSARSSFIHSPVQPPRPLAVCPRHLHDSSAHFGGSQKKALVALGIESADTAKNRSMNGSNPPARRWRAPPDCCIDADDEDWNLQYHRFLLEQYQSSCDRPESANRSQAGSSRPAAVRSSSSSYTGNSVSSQVESGGAGSEQGEKLWQYESAQLHLNRRDAKFRREAAGVSPVRLEIDKVEATPDSDSTSAGASASTTTSVKRFSRSLFRHFPQRSSSRDKDRQRSESRGSMRRRLRANRPAERAGSAAPPPPPPEPIPESEQEVENVSLSNLPEREMTPMPDGPGSSILSPPMMQEAGHVWPPPEIATVSSYESLNSLDTSRRAQMVEEVASSSSSMTGSVCLPMSPSTMSLHDMSFPSSSGPPPSSSSVGRPYTPPLLYGSARRRDCVSDHECGPLPELDEGTDSETEVEGDVYANGDRHGGVAIGSSESEVLFAPAKVELILEQFNQQPAPVVVESGPDVYRFARSTGWPSSWPLSSPPRVSPSPVPQPRVFSAGQAVPRLRTMKASSPLSPRPGAGY